MPDFVFLSLWFIPRSIRTQLKWQIYPQKNNNSTKQFHIFWLTTTKNIYKTQSFWFLRPQSSLLYVTMKHLGHNDARIIHKETLIIEKMENVRKNKYKNLCFITFCELAARLPIHRWVILSFACAEEMDLNVMSRYLIWLCNTKISTTWNRYNFYDFSAKKGRWMNPTVFNQFDPTC